MQVNFTHEDLILYIYNELNLTQKSAVEQALEVNMELKAEFNNLIEVNSALNFAIGLSWLIASRNSIFVPFISKKEVNTPSRSTFSILSNPISDNVSKSWLAISRFFTAMPICSIFLNITSAPA